MEIDTELNEKRTKLQVYEKVEQELDEVVMQAAQGNQHIIIISLFSGSSDLCYRWSFKKGFFL